MAIDLSIPYELCGVKLTNQSTSDKWGDEVQYGAGGAAPQQRSAECRATVSAEFSYVSYRRRDSGAAAAMTRAVAPSVTIALKVVPRASTDSVVGWVGGVLKVRVKAPPQDGRANEAVEELLARSLGIKKKAVRIVAGHAATQKRATIEGLDRATLERLLPGS